MMTIETRAAATECIRLIGLLIEAKTPHSKALAVIIANRLVCVVRNGPGDLIDEKELEDWLILARELQGSSE